jgi:MFS family permease
MHQKIWNRDFILLTLANFLLCITYYALISTLPIYMSTKLRAGESAIGVVLAAFTIAAVSVRPFSGFALDKFGRKTIYLIAMLLYTAVFAGYLIAASLLLITILRFLQGLGWGVASISGSTIAIDIIPKGRRGEGIGYYTLSTTLGMSVGPVIGLLLCNHLGYNAMFSGLLITSFLGLLFAYLLRMPAKVKIDQNLDLNVHNLFDVKSVLPSVNLLIIMMAYGGLLSFVALYGHQMGVQNTSIFFFVFAIGIGISRVIAGKAFDKHGPAKILTICLSISITGFLILALMKNPVGYYLSAIIIGFGNGVVFPVFQTMVSNLASPEHRGAANSTLYTCLDIGMGVGMMLMGVISERTSISIGFLCCAFLCVIGLIFFRQKVKTYYEGLIRKSRR